jgi:hypothetical protein
MDMPFKDTGDEDGGRRENGTPAEDKDRSGVSGAAAALVDAVPDEAEADDEQSKTKENREGLREKVTLGFVILTTVGVFWQARILDRSDDAMHTTLYLGQRAFVHLDKIEISTVPSLLFSAETKGNTVIKDVRNAGKMLRSTFYVTNAGNTPTKEAIIKVRCGFAAKLKDPYELLRDGEVEAIRTSIGAKQTIAFSVDTCDFANHAINYQMRQDPIFLAGEIVYRDYVRPEIVHRTQFGHLLVRSDLGEEGDFTTMTVTTAPIGRHNCTDQDCPNPAGAGF